MRNADSPSEMLVSWGLRGEEPCLLGHHLERSFQHTEKAGEEESWLCLKCCRVLLFLLSVN